MDALQKKCNGGLTKVNASVTEKDTAIGKRLISNIRSLRKRKGITQAAAAKGININDKLYNAWENGRSLPAYVYIFRLSHFYKISIHALLKKDF